MLGQDLHGQQGGTVNFGNNNSTKVLNGLTGNPVTTNENIRAALYGAPFPSTNFLQLGDTITNVGFPLPGIFAGGTRTNGTGSPGGTISQFQVRAWGGGYSSYQEAASHGGVLVGQSGIIQVQTGNPTGAPPTPPASLVANGLQNIILTSSSGGTYLVLNCASNKTVQCGSVWDFDPPKATDTCGNTNLLINMTGTLTNGVCPKTITRSWLANDACSNSAYCSQTVTVLDSTQPLVMCVSNKTVPCHTFWTFDPPSVSGSCDQGNVTVTLQAVITNSLCPQTLTGLWVAMDACGHSNTCSQRVTILCQECPVLQLTKVCPPYAVPPGGTLSFTGTITNKGDVPLMDVIVLNDKPASNTLVFGPAFLGPGDGASFGASYTAVVCSGTVMDTLTTRGRSFDGTIVTNFLTVGCAVTNYGVPGDVNGDGIVDQTELEVVLANYWPHSPWLYMTNPVAVGHGLFQFELTNAATWNFSVIVSSNLIDWTSLPNLAYPVYQFLDPAVGTNSTSRFYRLRWP